MAKKTGISTEAMVGVGATVAAVSAAAYMLFGPDAKKNRKTVRGWAVKMKGEIIENFEKAQDISEPLYHEIIDRVVAKYEKAKDIDPEELKSVVADIRKHWKALSKNSKPKGKTKGKVQKSKATVKKTVSKVKKAVSSKAK